MIFWGVIFALGAGLNIILGWHGWPNVLTGNLADPESYMRLVRIEAGLPQGRLLNGVPRDQSGMGVLLEWSHLLDMVLIATAAPLAILIGWKSALFAAAVAAGPLTAGMQSVSLAYAARPFAEDRLLWTAAIAASLSPAMHVFALPGAINDCGMALVFLSLAAGCGIRAWRGGIGHAFLGGMCGGFAVWLTPEILPLVLLGLLPVLLRWLQKPHGALVAAATAGFFDVIGFAFAIDPPKGGYFVADTHRLSLVYAVLAILLLLGGTTIWRLQDGQYANWRKPAGLGVIAAGLVVWVLLFPEAILAGVALLAQSPGLSAGAAFQCLGAGIFALSYAVWRAFSGRSRQWVLLAILLLFAILTGIRLTLFAAAAAAAGAALLPVLLSDINQRLRSRFVMLAVARCAAVAGMIALPYLPALASKPSAGRTTSEPGAVCRLHHVDALLGNDKTRIVLAMPSETPELLYRTRVDTVGSFYPASSDGYRRAKAAWNSPPGRQEPEAVRATGASLVLFCPLARRDPMLDGQAGGTLWDALKAGTVPPWLVLQAQDPVSGWQLYTVR